MDDRTDLFAHYEVDEDMIKMFNDKIDNANGSQMTYRQHKRAGHKLGWVFTNVTIGGRSEKRMVVCWHDDKNNPLDVPTRFPALDIVAPAGPVKAWYVQMSDVLRYHEGGIGGANQKVVFDHESTDPRFAEWQEFVKDVDDVLNKGRCTFLAKNAAEVAGSYLSKNELKYINKHGPEKGQNGSSSTSRILTIARSTNAGFGAPKIISSKRDEAKARCSKYARPTARSSIWKASIQAAR